MRGNVLGILTVASLALMPATAMAASVKLVATLDGASETSGGDLDGTGRFSAEVDAETGDVCYVLVANKISKPVAAHIHAGAAGTDGAPVLTLEVTGPDGDLCMAAEPDVLKPIVAGPEGYYVNVHTADVPKGAVRGQLSKSP
ncbi:MAG: CHRD domain-containing protein [Alphaproteobacteria bacterium]|nr:CHRD domain-containing protein [Alphaproteobacteria bacterium]